MAYRGYLQLEDKTAIPEQLADKMELAYQKATAKEAYQHFALEEIRQAFAQNGIDFVPLKGAVLKYLYPAPQMRSMCDLDILYKEACAEDAARCLKELGYSLKSSDEEQDIYFKPPHINLELHKILLAKPEVQRSFFDKIWTRVIPVNDAPFEYAMTLEDYYLYMLAHMAKHFFNSGTGLRSLTDFHVFYHAKGSELDRARIREHLQDLGLAQFEAFLLDLDAWIFGGEECTDESLRLAFEYILDSGIYGTSNNAYKNEISRHTGERNSTGRGKLYYLLHAIFPDRKNMEYAYPWLKERRYLLVLAWICRLFKKIFFSRHRIAERWSYTQLEDQELNKQQLVQKRAGL